MTLKELIETYEGFDKEKIMETRPTMALNELTCDLRKCGVKTSPTKVKAMIQQGKYSEFANSCEMADTEFEIYRNRLKNGKKRMGLRKE